MDEPEKLPDPEPAPMSADEPFVYDLNAPNLVQELELHPKGRKFLMETADMIAKGFDDEFDASKKWRDRFSQNWDIVSGFLPPKTGRFKDMANAHIPEALKNLVQQHLLLFDEIWGDFTDFMECAPNGDEPVVMEQARIITKHMHWQFAEQITDFPRQMDRATMHFLFGDVVIRSYYDPEQRVNRHEVMAPDDFVTPYAHVSCAPDFSDVPWTAFKWSLYRHQLEATRDSWAGVDRVLASEPPPWDLDPGSPFATQANMEMGKEPIDSKYAPYVMIQWEGWLTLPKPDDEMEEDFSRQRFMQVIIDKRSKNILSMLLFEEEDWQDRVRYRNQMTERDAFVAEATAADQEAMAYQQLSQQLQQQVVSGMMTPELAEVQRAAAQAMVRPHPSPASWMEERGMDEMGQPPMPEPMRMVPIYLKTHIVAIEPLAGVYGLGMAHIQADLNVAMNISFSQYSDAAAFSNAQCMVAAPNVEFEEAEPEVGAGKIIKLKGMPYQSLGDAMMPFSAARTDPAMMTVVDKLHEYATGFGQASDVLTGAPGKSGEAFRGLQARMEAAQRPISTMGAKLARGMTRLLVNHAKLNSVHMREEELFNFYDSSQSKRRIPFAARRAMYDRTYAWRMTATMRFETNTQQVAEADELVGLLQIHPLLQNNIAFVHGVVSNAVLARGRSDLAELLGSPPPRPETPFGMPPPAPPPPSGVVPPGADVPPGAPNGAPPPEQLPQEAPPPVLQ